MPLADLPMECLQGRLGEICIKRFKHFPRAYSWIALLTAGSAVIDQDLDTNPNDPRVNLYSCLVGEVHSGKSQAIDAAVKALGLEEPTLIESYAGSAEAFARSVGDAGGNPRLWAVDELGYLLEKAHIEHSTIPQVLCTAFNKNHIVMHMGKRETRRLNCSLSILGGMVDNRFSDLFGKNTTAGLYDRFMFGHCPGDFLFNYEPFNGTPEIVKRRPGDVLLIDPEIWEWRKHYMKTNPDINPRLIEIVLRCALICAYFDGEQRVDVKRLEPHVALLGYQTRMRIVLKPNPGENFEAQLTHKFLNYLQTHPGFVPRRKLFRDTNAYDKGLSVADRALDMLIATNDVVQVKMGRQQQLVRLALDSENEEESLADA